MPGTADTHVPPDVDEPQVPVRALRVEIEDREHEIPIHQHGTGQLVIALRGAVSCEVPGSLWMVPPQAGVWIPGGTPHSNHSTANAVIFYLFIAPGAAALPARCCTLRLSPLVSALIQHLASVPPHYEDNTATGRLVRVLLDQLCEMPTEDFSLPMPDDARLRRVSHATILDSTHCRTLTDWGLELGVSERTLNRACFKQTGLSFGRWRRQLLLIIALRELALGKTVQQVAFHLGYESASAFSAAFKKAFGEPPAAYISKRLHGTPP